MEFSLALCKTRVSRAHRTLSVEERQMNTHNKCFKGKIRRRIYLICHKINTLSILLESNRSIRSSCIDFSNQVYSCAIDVSAKSRKIVLMPRRQIKQCYLVQEDLLSGRLKQSWRQSLSARNDNPPTFIHNQRLRTFFQRVE